MLKKSKEDVLAALRDGIEGSSEGRDLAESVGSVLLAIAQAGCGVKVGRRGERMSLFPKDRVTPELIEKVKPHKKEIIEAVQDDELERTGRIQCERHAFQMARDWIQS